VVGRESFVEEVHKNLGYKAKGRRESQLKEFYLRREAGASDNTLFEGKNMNLRAENTYLRNLS
jgi:hypothetical protein